MVDASLVSNGSVEDDNVGNIGGHGINLLLEMAYAFRAELTEFLCEVTGSEFSNDELVIDQHAKSVVSLAVTLPQPPLPHKLPLTARLC